MSPSLFSRQKGACKLFNIWINMYEKLLIDVWHVKLVEGRKVKLKSYEVTSCACLREEEID